MDSEQSKIDQLEKRLDYAARLIKLMGNEIIEWTPRHKRKQAVIDLAAHLDIVNGNQKL